MLDDFRQAGDLPRITSHSRGGTLAFILGLFPISLCVHSFSQTVFLYSFVFPSVLTSNIEVFVN